MSPRPKILTDLWCPHCGSQENTLSLSGSRGGEGLQGAKYLCNSPDCGKTTVVPLKQPPPNYDDILDKKLPNAKRYVITGAQNATPVHRKFFDSLLTYCEHNGAELVVVPLRYKNPTSKWTHSQRNSERWEVEEKYLYRTRGTLNKNLTLLGDIKTQPTAAKPLTGFESIAGGSSGILAHPKVQCKTIATPHHHLPAILTTTGVCTQANYTDSKAGKKGEFHHTLGAIVVEIEDDEIFFLRQINALKNGTFIDLWLKYTPKGVEQAPPAGGLVMGDTHVEFIDPQVEAATFGSKNSIVKSLSPQHLVWHDLLDGYSRNPHHRQNPFIEMAKRSKDLQYVKQETERAIEFIRNRTGENQRSVVVPSNHNDFMTRWIMDTDWKRDPDNAEFYLETALAMCKSVRMAEHGAQYVDPFVYWAKKELESDTFLFPERNQSYTIRGIEVNLHGDQGPNGARGTIEGFRRIGAKSVVGHSHTPGIEEGCYQVGTSTHLRLEYNSGPSSWMNTHCIIYDNGKRSLVHIMDGRWRIE